MREAACSADAWTGSLPLAAHNSLRAVKELNFKILYWGDPIFIIYYIHIPNMVTELKFPNSNPV